MTIHIRPALPSDCETLANIQVDSYRMAYKGIFPQKILDAFTYEEQEKDWQEWLTEKPEDHILVAEITANEVVGYILARPGPTKLPPYDGEVMALHIRSKYQQRGIGRALFLEAARELKAAGSLSLLVWVLERNQPAIRFYERLGGIETGRQAIELENGTSLFELAFGWLDINRLWA